MSQAELYRRAKFEEVMGREPTCGQEVAIFWKLFKAVGVNKPDANCAIFMNARGGGKTTMMKIITGK